MTTSNNLNQLLSRVKTIFGCKTHHEDKPSEFSPQAPLVSDQRLHNTLFEAEKYLTQNYGTTSSAFTYKEY